MYNNRRILIFWDLNKNIDTTLIISQLHKYCKKEAAAQKMGRDRVCSYWSWNYINMDEPINIGVWLNVIGWDGRDNKFDLMETSSITGHVM